MTSTAQRRLNIARAFSYTMVIAGWMMIARYLVSGQPQDTFAKFMLFAGTVVGTIMVVEAELSRRRVLLTIKAIDDLAQKMEEEEDRDDRGV